MKYARALADEVVVTEDAGVLRVMLNRARIRNALSLGILERLREIFSDAAGHGELRLAVLIGAGDKAFASGGDLVELAALRSSAEAEAMSKHGKRALNSIRNFPVPVVAAMNGLSLGGGAELALACDLRFAAAHASIGFIHSGLNICPSWGGGIDLMRLTSYARGLSLLASAKILSADEALAAGLVDGVAPAADFESALENFLAPLRRLPPQVARAAKALSLAERMRQREQLEENETQHFVEVWTHQDHWAAATAIADRARRHE